MRRKWRQKSNDLRLLKYRSNAQTSVVAHDTTWKGDLESDGSVHVHGRVEGSIRAKQDIFIAEEADVDATLTATNIVIAGLIKAAFAAPIASKFCRKARFPAISTRQPSLSRRRARHRPIPDGKRHEQCIEQANVGCPAPRRPRQRSVSSRPVGCSRPPDSAIN